MHTGLCKLPLEVRVAPDSERRAYGLLCIFSLSFSAVVVNSGKRGQPCIIPLSHVTLCSELVFVGRNTKASHHLTPISPSNQGPQKEVWPATWYLHCVLNKACPSHLYSPAGHTSWNASQVPFTLHL